MAIRANTSTMLSHDFVARHAPVKIIQAVSALKMVRRSRFMKHAVLPLLGMTLVAGLFMPANAATFAQFTQGGNNTKIFALTGAGPNQVFETTGGNFVSGIQFVFPIMDPTDPYALHAADGVDGDGPDDLVGQIIKAKLKLTA